TLTQPFGNRSWHTSCPLEFLLLLTAWAAVHPDNNCSQGGSIPRFPMLLLAREEDHHGEYSKHQESLGSIHEPEASYLGGEGHAVRRYQHDHRQGARGGFRCCRNGS